MLKKILALMLAVVMLGTFAVGCKKKPVENGSSDLTSGVTSDVISDPDEDVSSSIADEESSDLGDEVGDNSSYWPYPWVIETQSALFRDTSEAKESVTQSSGIKEYSDYMLMSYHLSMTFTTAYGTDDASREKEFAEVVAQKYFNAYRLPMDKYLLTEAKYVAEAGASIWLSPPEYNSAEDDLDEIIENVEFYINMLKNNGYGDIICGFQWDEPIWRGQSNDDFLAITEALYKKFGLRNFPVFATGEFTNLEANENQLGVPGTSMGKVATAATKYCTDIGFDGYSVDVRDGAPNGSVYESWKEVAPGINSGKTFYTELKKVLRKHVGHDANFWHFPCAYTTSLYGGLNGLMRADEDYCIAHLDFLAQDILDDEQGGGIVIYTYKDNAENALELGFQSHMDLKGSDGKWAIDPEITKWEKYSNSLRTWSDTFSSKETKLVKLDV